jgi:glycosyltransferase involved in cell wall biosynthesis
MAGAAIRAVELARAAASVADVTVAAPSGTLPDLPVAAFHPHDARTLAAPLARADAVYGVAQWPLVMRALRRSGARLIFDLYVPEYFETLEGFRDRAPLLRRLMAALALDRIEDALTSADLLLCASERQRDLLTGLLLGLRGVPPRAYDLDRSLEARLAVVPFGVPATPPARTGAPGPKARFAAEQVVLWNGGIWGWLDPETAIRAVARLDRPGLRLVFMGAAPGQPARRTTQAAKLLAAQLDAPVDFHDEWVPYDERADWLLDADAVISCHHDQLETRYAFRTRLLDCFWARVPIVCTSGDDLAARIERENLGATAAPEDVEGMAAGLARVLDGDRAAYGERLGRTARELTWPRTAAPLVTFLGSLPPGTSAGAGTRAGTSAGTGTGAGTGAGAGAGATAGAAATVGGGPARGTGGAARGGRARHPARALRTAGYAATRTLLNLAGLRDWPRV